jgi:serine protease Do
VSRIPALRSALVATVGLGAAVLLSGCFGPAPTPTETPKPTPNFGAIGGDETPVPIETGTPIEPVEPAESGFTSVLDDLGVLTVTVPDDWTDVNGAPFTSDAGQEWASITVAPDIQGYLDTWSVPGLEIGATGTTGVTDDGLLGLLASITEIYGSCETVVSDASPYDDGFFTGFESVFEGCGSDDTSAFAIASTNAAGTQAVFVRAQITSDLDANEIYLAVVNSFDTTLGRSAQSK